MITANIDSDLTFGFPFDLSISLPTTKLCVKMATSGNKKNNIFFNACTYILYQSYQTQVVPEDKPVYTVATQTYIQWQTVFILTAPHFTESLSNFIAILEPSEPFVLQTFEQKPKHSPQPSNW